MLLNLKSNSHRLLHLRQLLFNETDENHELDLKQVREKLLQRLQVDKIDHRTIKNDLQSLQEMDFDIVQNRRNHGKICYSHQAKLFETYQLRFLVDAILSARFITPREKNRLIKKIKKLTSIHTAKTLPEPIMFSQTINLDYDLIKLNIDRIHHAIANTKVIRYRYGDFNVVKDFEFRRNGNFYVVEPYALIWQNDLYYLIGRYRENDQIRHYRLDRMRDIESTDQSFQKDPHFELQTYVDNSFHMYSGMEAQIMLRVHMELLNAMFDRFGLEVDVQQETEESFILKTKAKLSDGLVSWILKWGSRVQVLSPTPLLQEVRREVQQMADLYEKERSV